MITRRQLLTQSIPALTASGLLTSLGGLPSAQAAIATASDYKALVCIFLYGGNDANNMVIPLDGYDSYLLNRPVSSGINISKDQLLPIHAASHRQQFGLHPSLVELQQLYQANKLAVLCNTGTLIRPISRQHFLNGQHCPNHLFSHADQQKQWQLTAADALAHNRQAGWGGQLAELWQSTTQGLNGFPINIAQSMNTFSIGQTSFPVVPGTPLKGFGSSKAEISRKNALTQAVTDGRVNPNSLVKIQSDWMTLAIDANQLLNNAISTAPKITTVFPKTALGTQLQTVASLLASRQQLGNQRQIFFCSLGGFDTHSGQLSAQKALFSQLSQAMQAFYNATQALNLAKAVTTFTLSEFGRTMKPSAGGGSDHGWGSHHFIMGDAVNGGDFYGRYPTLQLKGDWDAGTEGRWIPTTSVEEYGSRLASWFAPINPAELFPNIDNFDRNRSDLWFIG